jgi:hypothetical protein
MISCRYRKDQTLQLVVFAKLIPAVPTEMGIPWTIFRIVFLPWRGWIKSPWGKEGRGSGNLTKIFQDEDDLVRRILKVVKCLDKIAFQSQRRVRAKTKPKKNETATTVTEGPQKPIAAKVNATNGKGENRSNSKGETGEGDRPSTVCSFILAKERFLDPVDHGKIRSILQYGDRLHIGFLDQGLHIRHHTLASCRGNTNPCFALDVVPERLYVTTVSND